MASEVADYGHYGELLRSRKVESLIFKNPLRISDMFVGCQILYPNLDIMIKKTKTKANTQQAEQ